MHELSIALSLVDAAAEHATRMAPGRVEALHVRIGRLSGVSAEALDFSFELASQGTAIEGARLAIERVAVAVRCSACKAEAEVADVLPACPACGRPGEIVRGRELELVALEVADGLADG